MWSHINKSQVEEKYGGTAPNVMLGDKEGGICSQWPPKPVPGDIFTENF